jgi:hypothetical protein
MVGPVLNNSNHCASQDLPWLSPDSYEQYMRVPAATEGIVLLSLWRRLQLRHDINNRAPYSFTKPSRGNKTIPRVVHPSHAVQITQVAEFTL